LRCETVLEIAVAEGRAEYRQKSPEVGVRVAELRGQILIRESEKAFAEEFYRRLSDVGYIARLKAYYRAHDAIPDLRKRAEFKRANAPELMREYARLTQTFLAKYSPKVSDASSVFGPIEKYESVSQKHQAEHGRMIDIRPALRAKYTRYQNAEAAADGLVPADSLIWSSSLNWLLGDYDRKQRAALEAGDILKLEDFAVARLVDKTGAEELPRRILFEGGVGKLRKKSPDSTKLDAVSESAASFDLLADSPVLNSYSPRKKSDLFKGAWEAVDLPALELAAKAEEDASVAKYLQAKGYADDLAECAKLKAYEARAKVYTGILAKPASGSATKTKNSPAQKPAKTGVDAN
jgi:hypothetical protein